MAKAAIARQQGRPRAGAPNHRGRLLEAARDSFARGGYEATTLRQVAVEAGVTPALAHYYFSDKAGLLDAVLREQVAPLLEGIRTVLAEHAGDPAGALARFVQQFTVAGSRHPWLPQLILREEQFLRPLMEQLRELVAAGQASRAIRPDLCAEWIVQSVVSLCVFPFLSGAVDAGTVPALTLHHLAVLQDGLKNPSYNPRQESGSYAKAAKSRT